MTGPIPSWNKVPLTGKYADAKGNPLTGTIRFTPSVRVADVTDRVMVVPATFEAVLDAEGAFSIELPATDDPDIVPSGFTYTVVEEITGGETYSIELSVTALPGGVDLTIAARAVPIPAVVTYVTFAQLNAAMASGELNGASAYDVAVSNGYLGTESEWLLSLQADMSIVNSKVAIPAAAEKVMFVTPRGNDANDGATLSTAKATIQAALAALGGPGRIQLGYGTFSTPDVIDVSARVGVQICGVGGVTAGATPPTSIIYTGTGAQAINAQSSVGFRLRDVMVLYSNAAFTGVVVDFRQAAGGMGTALPAIEDCYIGGAQGQATAAAGVALHGSYGVSIRNSLIHHCINGVKGLDDSGATSYATGITLDNVHFLYNVQAHVRNVNQGWVVLGCIFEQLLNGSAGAIKQDPGYVIKGLSVTGCWLGDIRDVGGGIQFDLLGYSIDIRGNFIGHGNGATGVRMQAGSAAFSIESNTFVGGGVTTVGIDTTAGQISNYSIGPNDFLNVTTPYSPDRAPVSIDRNTAAPLAILHNSSTASGSALIRFQADRTSIKQYDLGMDPGGGASKSFSLYDRTANVERWRVPSVGGFVVNPASLATTATDGFFYAPVMAGPPTGAPTAQAGGAAVVVEDSATPKIWVRIGSTWKSATLV